MLIMFASWSQGLVTWVQLFCETISCTCIIYKLLYIYVLQQIIYQRGQGGCLNHHLSMQWNILQQLKILQYVIDMQICKLWNNVWPYFIKSLKIYHK